MLQRSALSIVLVFCGVSAATARADEDQNRGADSNGVQVSGGFSLPYGMATGALAKSFDHGWGLLGHASFFKGRKPLGLALEGWMVEYGRETERRRLFEDTDRVLVDVDTSNWIGHLSLGPELAVRSGRIRPYARALVGLTYFATSTSVEGSSDVDSFATTTQQDDLKLSGAICSGARISLSRGGSVALDVNVRYVINGEADYLVEGDIHEAADGRLLFEPRHTQANLLVFGVGLSFGR